MLSKSKNLDWDKTKKLEDLYIHSYFLLLFELTFFSL